MMRETVIMVYPAPLAEQTPVFHWFSPVFVANVLCFWVYYGPDLRVWVGRSFNSLRFALTNLKRK